MRDQAFIEYCSGRGMGQGQITQALAMVRRFEQHLTGRGRALESADASDVADYFDTLPVDRQVSVEDCVALARYFRMTDLTDAFIHLLSLVGGAPVYPSIAHRTEALAGEKVRAAVFDDLAVPAPGAKPQAYPPVTSRMIQRLQSEAPGEWRRILAGNHHQLPRAAYALLRDLYLSEGIDAVLARRREQLLAELEQHARSGKPWYEQIITPDVVAYVRANPETQAGVRHGDQIMVSKIPYAPVEYLTTTDPALKRYYQCHCPLARAGILDEGQGVDPALCYCSGGYEKLPFDVIFDTETEVEVLESALGGSTTCRFAIRIPR